MGKKKAKKSRAGSKVHLHCKLPDGTFRLVRARETDPAANVGAVATALTSSAFRHALRIYNAAVDDLETSATDIAFLRSVYETERQADLIEQILIAQTPPPMPPLSLLVLLPWTIRTSQD